MLEQITETFTDEEILTAQGFDDAVIGIDQKTMRLVYSVSKCLDILSQDMSRWEAREYFDFNVSGSYVGEKTPIWCEDEF